MPDKKKERIKLKSLRLGMIIEGRVIKPANYLTGRERKSYCGRFMVTGTTVNGHDVYQLETCDRKRRRHWVEGSHHDMEIEGEVVGRAVVLKRGSATSAWVLLDAKTGIIRAGCEYIDARDVLKKAAKALGYKLVKEAA